MTDKIRILTCLRADRDYHRHRQPARRRGWFTKSEPENPQGKRSRKPRIDVMIKQAERMGKNVTSITTPDGTMITFGQTKAEPEQTNDLDKWMAKRHAN